MQVNFQIGEVINNYKVMCTLLNQKECGGTQKKSQIKNWKRHFDFEKHGHKYIITDIYDKPLPKEDGRDKGNNSIYINNLELLLTDFLSKQEGYEYTLTRINWYELLGMINSRYADYKSEQLPLSQIQTLKPEISKFMLNHFYQQSDSMLNSILFDALNNMKKRRLINYYEQYMIIDMILEDGKVKRYDRVAEPFEESLIIEAQRDALEILELDNLKQVFQKFFAKKVLYASQRTFDRSAWMESLSELQDCIHQKTYQKRSGNATK